MLETLHPLNCINQTKYGCLTDIDSALKLIDEKYGNGNRSFVMNSDRHAKNDGRECYDEDNNVEKEKQNRSIYKCQARLYRLVHVDNSGNIIRAVTENEAEKVAGLMHTLSSNLKAITTFTAAVDHEEAMTKRYSVDSAANQVIVVEEPNTDTLNPKKNIQYRPGGPCDHCGVRESPQWRRGPPNKPKLCNACGTRYSRANRVGLHIPSSKISSSKKRSVLSSLHERSKKRQVLALTLP